MNEQAEELNKVIKEQNKDIYDMLSKKGKEIFFPKKGILGQTAEAKGSKINATIGIAKEDNGEAMALDVLANKVKLPKDKIFPYAPSFGLPEIREKWQKMIKEKNPSIKSEISLPVVTIALTHGLSVAGYLFVDEGDELIIPTPLWGNYNLIFANAYNANIKNFECFKDNKFNIEAFKETLKGKDSKKIVLLNFPNNPTGYTPTDEEIDEIVNAIKESAENNKIIVLCDDAYFGLVYKKGIFKESIFAKLCDLSENVLAVKIDGATKEDYVWGLRVGFITYGIKNGNKELYNALEAKTAGAIRGNVSNAANLSQSLILEGMADKYYKKEKQEKYEILKERFDEIEKVLNEHKEYEECFEPLPFNSGYFMCLKLNKDAENVRQILLEKYSIGTIALGKLLRIAFSCVKKELLEEMFESIYKVCKEN